jgi:hypothetical protein
MTVRQRRNVRMLLASSLVASVGLLATLVTRLWTRDGHWVLVSVLAGLGCVGMVIEGRDCYRRLRVFRDGG